MAHRQRTAALLALDCCSQPKLQARVPCTMQAHDVLMLPLSPPGVLRTLWCQPGYCADLRLASVPAQEQESWQHVGHLQPQPWPSKSACTPSNHKDLVTNGLQQHLQPEQCSPVPQSPCTCRHQVHFTCAQSSATDDLFTKPPSQGVENDSLGLDQRLIMSELAASRYMLPLDNITSWDIGRMCID